MICSTSHAYARPFGYELDLIKCVSDYFLLLLNPCYWRWCGGLTDTFNSTLLVASAINDDYDWLDGVFLPCN